MKSKQKGNSHEREKAKDLSLWWYGEPDVLIRGGSSGATPTKRRYRSGETPSQTFGEFVQVSRFDDPFPFAVECKHRKDFITIPGLLMRPKHPFWLAWLQCVQATPKGKVPLLIWRTNREKELAALPSELLSPLLYALGLKVPVPDINLLIPAHIFLWSGLLKLSRPQIIENIKFPLS